jgi:arylsulfatase A-like enzyme
MFFGLIRTLLVTLLLLFPFSCRSPEPKPPNILFLFADDQRADTISSYGNTAIQTPNLDRLVERGFSFRSNYNMGSEQGAVCVPSRAMVNSGLNLFGVATDLTGTRTLPEVLAEQGYTTFATGKWHNKRPSWLRSFQRGKNVFFDGMSDHTRVPLEDLLPNGELGSQRVGEGFSSELFADAAIEFLDTYSEEAPFYAYVSFTAPHDPRQPPFEFRQMYYGNPPPLPRNFMPQHPFDLGPHLTGRDERLAAWPRNQETITAQLAEYYGMITHLDQQIGRILGALERSGHAETTLIVFAADHGLALGSHGLLGKQNLYEHSQRCPLIFVGPGIPENQSSSALTYLFDVFPSVLALAGIEAAQDLDGKDLSPIWNGKQESVRNSLFLAYMDEMRAVRDHRYKLIRYPQINHTQLFDLQSDPDELNNLAEHSSQEKRVEQLLELMKEWQEQVGDSLPLTVAEPRSKEIDLSGRARKPDRWQPEWIIEKYFN